MNTLFEKKLAELQMQRKSARPKRVKPPTIHELQQLHSANGGKLFEPEEMAKRGDTLKGLVVYWVISGDVSAVWVSRRRNMNQRWMLSTRTGEVMEDFSKN